jgi:hypothetical protein
MKIPETCNIRMIFIKKLKLTFERSKKKSILKTVVIATREIKQRMQLKSTIDITQRIPLKVYKKIELIVVCHRLFEHAFITQKKRELLHTHIHFND